MLPEPWFLYREWSIKEAPHLRVQIIERPGVNFYTCVVRSEDGAWVAVRDSARGHGLDPQAAEKRAEALLGSGWKDFDGTVPLIGPSLTDLHKLWEIVEKWSRDWPLSSGDELARLVRPIVGKDHPAWLDEGQASPL